ncbi:hypothetical protein [Williamsia sp. CHRR-6]|uniref:DUF7373 family lipoprotein n=1 Tax=Williamsia sp. CHRR-6 TaxID=2835871 RepID=UPI001BDA6A6C|nr:hypothetical protein [Williamsia sp. CHRR-6]MBT0568557.1 hypothetical protein [Williamsia sp. CHRR-6]
MPLPKMYVSFLVGVITTLCLASCSSGETGTARSQPSSGTPSVNLAALDTGSFATSPRREFGTATKTDISDVESQRMAEFVTLPFEIDPTFTSGGRPIGTISGTPRLFVDGAAKGVKVLTDNSILAAFFTTARRPGFDNNNGPASVTHAVLRFRDAASARTAAQGLLQEELSRLKGTKPDTPPELPQSFVLWSDTVTEVITPHDDYVLMDRFFAPTDQHKAAYGLAIKSLSLQKPLIDKFPKTRPAVNATIKIDQNKILLYALESPDASGNGGLAPAVYGPRGTAHVSIGPARTLQVLTDAGSTHNAYWLTQVYRAATADKASTLVAEFGRILIDAGFAPADPPKGLPMAKCFSRDGDIGKGDDCLVQVGRYVGESGDQDATITRQQISAQYKILTQADQNAN